MTRTFMLLTLLAGPVGCAAPGAPTSAQPPSAPAGPTTGATTPEADAAPSASGPSPDGAFDCPEGGYGRRCKADEICRVTQRGARVASCVPNPCPPGPLSCACAALCGGYACSLVPRAPREVVCTEDTRAP